MRSILERAKGFEPSTPTLARSCSTTELHPHPLRLAAAMRRQRAELCQMRPVNATGAKWARDWPLSGQNTQSRANRPETAADFKKTPPRARHFGRLAGSGRLKIAFTAPFKAVLEIGAYCDIRRGSREHFGTGWRTGAAGGAGSDQGNHDAE